jgi:hypothetical protein
MSSGNSRLLQRPDAKEMPCEECRRLVEHIESFRQRQAPFFEAEYRRHLEKAHGLKP